MKLWIARDKNEYLYLYTEEPKRESEKFILGTFSSECIGINGESFPEVTWENSPKQVELKLID